MRMRRSDGALLRCPLPSICYVYFSSADEYSYYACAIHRDWAIKEVAATPYGRGHVYYVPIGEAREEIERERTKRIESLRERRMRAQRERAQRWTGNATDQGERPA